MNILLIEDDPALRKTAAAALALCGHNVALAENGVEALVRVDALLPHLVVLDLHMPDMDGWEFLRRFRAMPACAAIPVVAMSAALRVAVEELDVQAFFAKPFDLDEFIDVVEQLLAAPAGPGGAHAGSRTERACGEE